MTELNGYDKGSMANDNIWIIYYLAPVHQPQESAIRAK